MSWIYASVHEWRQRVSKDNTNQRNYNYDLKLTYDLVWVKIATPCGGDRSRRTSDLTQSGLPSPQTGDHA